MACKLMFLADITMHLNELDLRLQDTEQKVICLFELWKGFVSKLGVHNKRHQTKTFRYFKHLMASYWMTKLIQVKLIYT